jgi:hypothetical protein
LKSVCRALLVLNVLYCLLAAAQEGLPGWHMFESVERLDHTLRDRDGVPIDVRASLPRGAHLVDRGELRAIVTWICEHERARAPFVYEEGSPPTLRATLDADCRIHAPR